MPRPPKKFIPHPFTYHEIIDVTIDTLTNLGSGVARVNHTSEVGETVSGWVVFIPFALPGEKVRVKITRNSKNNSQAQLLQVLEPSKHRVKPRCKHFGYCGGCQYQHLDYAEQLKWKTEQVAGLLKHMAGIEHPVNPAIASPTAWNYRSKITPHVEKKNRSKVSSIGFLATGRSNIYVDIHECSIAMKEINEALPELRREVQARPQNYKPDETLLLRESDGIVETNPRAIASETVGNLQFHFLAGDFFQNNPYILPDFTEYVAKHASSSGAKFLVDAYCGSGLFALSLASSFEKVAGVEVSETATDWARQNARLNNIENVTFLAGSAESIFADIDFPGVETTVVIDPPRKGCNEEFLSQLFEFSPKRVVYVSCDPATQMRDLKAFAENSYSLIEVQPFDLFPHTRHLECVMVLERL